MNLSREEVLKVFYDAIERRKKQHLTNPFDKFRGGPLPVDMGIYGLWKLQLNSEWKIMKIITPDGLYWEP